VLLEVLSAVVALACALASARRLATVVAPMQLDPRILLDALQGDRDGRLPERLRAVLAGDARFAHEHELLEALAMERDDERDARLGEELSDLKGRVQQGLRVPRVCASIASSAGFLLGTMALIGAMGASGPANEGDTGGQAPATLGVALGALAVGIAGASFCAAVHMRARRVHRERMSAVTRLIESGFLSKRSNS
jgi:biopolymer transport protein ExbB/TolQ